jgi:hypothetical protein
VPADPAGRAAPAGLGEALVPADPAGRAAPPTPGLPGPAGRRPSGPGLPFTRWPPGPGPGYDGGVTKRAGGLGGGSAARAFRGAALAAALCLSGAGCGDEVDQLPCRFTVEDDGSRRMECPDGTSAVFPPPVSAPRAGSVSGTASLFGEPRRDGIDVWLIPAPPDPETQSPPLHAATDAEGRFRFDGVPPGVHRVSVRAPGFVDVDREVVVDPGEFVLPPVVLRRGVEALAGDNLELFPSPRGNSFLARYGEGTFRRLVYWEPGGAGMVPLGEQTVLTGPFDPPYFLAGGAYIHFLEKPDRLGAKGRTLMRYEVDAGRLLVVADAVASFWPSADGQSVVIQGAEGELRTWNRRHHDSGGGDRIVTAPASAWDLGPHSHLLAARTPGGSLVVWDLEELTGDVLGPWNGRPDFSPDGRVLVADLGSGLVVWDAVTSRAAHLGPGTGVTFHDSGRRFAYLATEGASQRLVHVDLDRGAVPETMRERVLSAFYGPGEGGIAWIEGAEGGVELFVAPGPGQAPVSLGRGAHLENLLWSRDGRRLFFTMFDGEAWVGRLDVYEPGLGTHTLAIDPLGWPFLEPGGDGVFFVVGSGDSATLEYWDPATDEVIRIVDGAVDTLGNIRIGPDARLLLAGAGGHWWRWDPADGTVLLLGTADAPAQTATFLADGAVAFIDSRRRLGLLDAGATEGRWVGTGVADVFVAPDLAQRFSYRQALSSSNFSRTGTLVLYDRAAGRAIPLDDGVIGGIQGHSFVAYVREGSGGAATQHLYLVTYPVGER